MRLILFDIDGTLYHGDGSGMAAFQDAGVELFGPTFTNDSVSYAGRLDSLIFQSLMERNGIEITPEREKAFRTRAHHYLRARIESGKHRVRRLPAVNELIAALKPHEGAREGGVTLGLLTGNWAANGRLKLASVGVNPDDFDVCVWAEDGPSRDALPPVGKRRFAELHGTEIEFERIAIVGDTIHDVNCAKAHGCKCLGVTTGHGSAEQLASAGADFVVQDFTDVAAVVRWLTEF